jgi:hypothetical protein
MKTLEEEIVHSKVSKTANVVVSDAAVPTTGGRGEES